MWGVNKWRQKMRAFVEPLRITMWLKYPCNVRKLAVSKFAATKSHKTSTQFEAVLLKGSSCISWPGFRNVFGKKTPTKQQNSPHVQDIHICREHQESLRELNRGWRRTTPLPRKEWWVHRDPHSICSLIFPVQPPPAFVLPEVGWVRKLLTLLFPSKVFIWESPIGLNPATTNFLGTSDCYEM